MKNEEELVYDAVTSFFGDIEEVSLSKEIEMLEKRRIKNALEGNEGNRTRAAKDLGIGRTLLIHKIKKYNLYWNFISVSWK